MTETGPVLLLCDCEYNLSNCAIVAADIIGDGELTFRGELLAPEIDLNMTGGKGGGGIVVICGATSSTTDLHQSAAEPIDFAGTVF